MSYVTTKRLDLERVFLDSLHVALARVRPPRGSVVYVSHEPHYMTFVTMQGRAPRVWFDDPSFDLEMIGEFRPKVATRPHSFLRFDGTRRGFMQVPNDAMDQDLAAEMAMNARQPDDARRHLERALALLPTGSLTPVRLDLLNNLGFAHVALGDTVQARRSWRAALELAPSFQSAALNLARIDVESGRLESARDELVRLLNVSPDAVDAWSMLVQVQRALEDLDGARGALERLQLLDPRLAETLREESAVTQPPR